MDKQTTVKWATLLALCFAAFWASGLSVRQAEANIPAVAHYVSRFVEIAVCVVLALAVRRGALVERRGLARAGAALTLCYCLFELVRLATGYSTVLGMGAGVAAGVANGALIGCLTLLIAWTLGAFSPAVAAVVVPAVLAGAHGIFLLMGFLPGAWVPLAKALLLVAATAGLAVVSARVDALVPAVSRPVGDAPALSCRRGALRVLQPATDPSKTSLWFGIIVFPLFYGLMAQICSLAGVSSGLFDTATEVVGIAILLLCVAGAVIWKGRFDAEATFAVVLPAFATALLFLPLFWDSEVFVSGFIMKCGFLVYTALMWTALHRLAYGDRRAALYVFGLSLGLYHLALMFGRLTATLLAAWAPLSFSTMAVVALVAVWVLSMAALAVMVAARRGGADRDGYDAAFEAFAQEGGLSERECAVLRDYARGRTVEYIAQQLDVSPETVKTHLKRAYAKTDCHSRQDLLDKIDQYKRAAARG